MGYLDGDTIVVDAVLTKKGRQILSEGGALNVTHFTLSDTGVDYTLWNADHPSGSAFYGEAIEKLPMVEANPIGQYALRNKLITLGRDTVAMPVLDLNYDNTQTKVFETGDSLPFIATILNYTGTGAAVAGGCQLLVHDANVVEPAGLTGIDVTGNARSFISDTDITNSQLYENMGGGPNFTFNMTPKSISAADGAYTNLTFIHTATGAYVTIQVHVKQNADLRRTIPTTTQQG